MRTRIKICGITRKVDVETAIEAGVDALGFVFYSKSPRYISPVEAKEIIKIIPAWVSIVGLFVNSTFEEINRVSDVSGLTHLQLHGDETVKACKMLNRPVIKAIRIPFQGSSEINLYDENIKKLLLSSRDYLEYCSAVLFDSFSDGYGGSGESFDWSYLDSISKYFGNNWVLSGGLDAANISKVVKQYSPPCIDVSSGVEEKKCGKLQKGSKDKLKIISFVNAVNLASNKI